MEVAPLPAPVVAQSERRVLLAVTGLTPQVVTETLFAMMKSEPSQLPHEVHVITTAEGAERVRLALLSESPGWLQRFVHDFGLAPIQLERDNIHVIQSETGQPLTDIRTAQDNVQAADQIADLVRRLTADDVTSLHVSMAGGRKTLGFFAGYALSLWGRSQDRLSHVLVGEPFEQSWDFFYPTPYEHIIETRNGKLADSALAEVTLADIPFVRLRHSLPRSLLDGRARFAEAVYTAQALVTPASLVIDLAGQRIKAAGQLVQLSPADLAFLAWFARRASKGLPGLYCPRDMNPSLEHGREYLAEYRLIRGPFGDDERTRARYSKGMAKTDFEERKSKLKRSMERCLGAAAQPYVVHGDGRRPMSYSLALPASAIEFRLLEDRPKQTSLGPSQ